MNPVLQEIFRTGLVCDELGNQYPLQANISFTEGQFLVSLIEGDPLIQRTLEIGCAYGISSLFICSALATRENPKHTIIDPVQSTFWHGVGIHHLMRSGVGFFELIEKGSEIALPELLIADQEKFDLIFIDGRHSFDQVCLDMYYANRLLRIGGYLVLDDCSFLSISKALAYFIDYPAYQLHRLVKETRFARKIAHGMTRLLPWDVWKYCLPLKLYDQFQRVRFTSMVALKKIAEDQRRYNWGTDF